MSERALQRRVVAYLRGRPNSFTVKLPGSVLMVGMPDVLHIENGVPYFFELKAPGGVPTPIQNVVMRRLARAGAKICVVKSLDTVRAALQDG